MPGYPIFKNMTSNIRRCLQKKKYIFILSGIWFLLMFVNSKEGSDVAHTPIQITQLKKRSFYICPILTGGLGNTMFLYASAYGIAKTTNRSMVLDENYLNNLFKLDEIPSSKHYCKSLPEIHSRYDCAFDSGMMNISKQTNYIVGDFLQSYKYFENHQNDIRRMFTMRDHIINSARNYLMDVASEYRIKTSSEPKDTSVTFIGVHVRRGNILLPHYSEYGYNTPGASYIKKAMKFMSGIFKNIAYVFSSNDMQWVKSNFKGPNKFYSNFTDPKLDFALLSSCNHSITTTGTYGWWAAYLAGGITLYYKYPAKDGSKLRLHYSSDYSDFFYPGWIGLS